MTETFIKERVHTATGKKQKVTIDDACAFLASLLTVRLQSLSPPATHVDTRLFTHLKSMVQMAHWHGIYMIFIDLNISNMIRKMPKPEDGAPFMLPMVESTHTWISGGFPVLISVMNIVSLISLLTSLPDMVLVKNDHCVQISVMHWKPSISARLFLIQLNQVAGKKWVKSVQKQSKPRTNFYSFYKRSQVICLTPFFAKVPFSLQKRRV